MEYIVEDSVKIGKNVTIEPFVVIKGNSVIEDNATIGSFSYIENSCIGSGSKVLASRITDSKVGDGTTVGPNAHLRSNAVVGNKCRIGNFVEVKNSNIGDSAKASHLSYIGDADVGKNVNIGCGVIFVNYDGKAKHRTTVGDNCFIGCNSNLVAPLTIGENSFVACGTTVDKDLPSGSFAIGRSRQQVKDGGAYKYIVKK